MWAVAEFIKGEQHDLFVDAEALDSGLKDIGSSQRNKSGRGSWIRTNDLQYPKLPRYQAALYPD
jgi:hypothetical protein